MSAWSDPHHEDTAFATLAEIYTRPEAAYAQTRRWRFANAYHNTRIDVVATLFFVAAIAYLFHGETAGWIISVWSILLLANAVARHLWCKSLVNLEAPRSPTIEQLFIGSMGTNAFLLVTAFFFIVPDQSVDERLIFLLFLTASSAWTSVAFASVLEGVITFLSVLMLPLAVGLLLSDEPFWNFTALATLVYLWAMVAVALRSSAVLLKGHLTQVVNSQLIAELERERDEVELLNSDLEADIRARVSTEVKLRHARNEAETLARELEELSWLDGLTAIANRRYLDKSLEREWGRAVRAREPIALIMADIDFFKQYNDRYHHQAGDACLRQFAVLLKSACRRSSDIAARYGGEEFAVLLPNTTLDQALSIAEAIRTTLVQLGIPNEDADGSKILTASFGVAATLPSSGTVPDDLVRAADRALYQAKSDGRNRVYGEPEVQVARGRTQRRRPVDSGAPDSSAPTSGVGVAVDR